MTAEQLPEPGPARDWSERAEERSVVTAAVIRQLAVSGQWSRPGTTPLLLPEKVNNQLGLTATAEQAGAAEPVLGTQCPI